MRKTDPFTFPHNVASRDVPLMALALSEYLPLARTLAARIVWSRSPPSAPPPDAHDHLDDASLPETLSRWGLHATTWLAKLERRVSGSSRTMRSASATFLSDISHCRVLDDCADENWLLSPQCRRRMAAECGSLPR